MYSSLNKIFKKDYKKEVFWENDLFKSRIRSNCRVQIQNSIGNSEQHREFGFAEWLDTRTNNNSYYSLFISIS